jgi:hypothetical protein
MGTRYRVSSDLLSAVKLVVGNNDVFEPNVFAKPVAMVVEVMNVGIGAWRHHISRSKLSGIAIPPPFRVDGLGLQPVLRL